MASQITADVRDRAIRLMEYLRGIAQIKSRPTRSLKNYEDVLWLHDVPREQGCFCRTWSAEAEGDETGGDLWIEITKQREPLRPPVPELCERWVDDSTLSNDGKEPRLLDQIVVDATPSEPAAALDDSSFVTTPQVETLYLQDHPEVQADFERYLAQQWRPWAEVHQRWRSVQQVYSTLFRIHQAQQRLGEEYELVIGLGLLQWRPRQGQTIFRHLVTAQASLEFDAERGTLTVGPGADGAKLDIETDMLDAEDRPGGQVSDAKQAIAETGDDPWDRDIMDPILLGLAQALADDGEYDDARIEPWPQTERKARVPFAPALLLRKRSVQGLLLTISAISEQLRNGGDAPAEFIDLAEGPIAQEGSGESQESRTDDPESAKRYFPLPTNEAQRRIADRLASTTGVLVQGPPGTGKSHSIANLISHLLATGHRVLVTAKTPRALQVLHGQLPEEIQPLCISLLGEGAADQRSLEASVSNILTRQDQWEEEEIAEKIDGLDRDIDQMRRRGQKISNDIASIYFSETQTHSVSDGQYHGTAASIARKLDSEKEEYGWIPDAVDPDQEQPLPNSDAVRLHGLLLNRSPERERELSLQRPSLDEKVIDTELLEQRFASEALLSRGLEGGGCLHRVDAARPMQDLSDDVLKSLANRLRTTAQSIDRLNGLQSPWVSIAVRAVLDEQDNRWRELHKALRQRLTGLADCARQADHRNVVIPEEIDRAALRHDAAALLAHFEAGGRRGWWIFRSKTVRSRRYVMHVSVDGVTCDNTDSLQRLVEVLSCEEDVDRAWNLWGGQLDRVDGPLALQVAEVQQHFDTLTETLRLGEHVAELRRHVAQMNDAPNLPLHQPDEQRRLASIAEAVVTARELDSVQADISWACDRLRDRLHEGSEHPVTWELCEAIEARDPARLNKGREVVSKLEADAERYAEMERMLKVLHEAASKLAHQLETAPDDSGWPQRLRRFDRAWLWSRAKGWLHKRFDKDDLASLERELHRLDEEILNQTGYVASLRAWRFCFSRLTEAQRRHLTGWQQAFRRIGKTGKGKHAPRHAREAKEHLKHCRDAVPAWVMPLHRVYDTVAAEPNAFDVIIIDEASQCGPDALPLLYLGKRILVVGDDQQISPEAVGVNRDEMVSLRKEYLYDFDHHDSFDVEGSLFAHAQRRFGNRTVLREHFRCMPEIIRFSNDLCYHDTPLIPLRQYPPKRLRPIEHRYVNDGYREGSGSYVVNQPEAEVIAETIVACCRDEQYANKTMGVVTLQGHRQARLIDNLLLEKLDPKEIEARRIVCGDAYSFQGDERDVMFLSMVAAPNERIGPLTKPADRRRFNVAASRARDQMWLFHSVTRNDLGESDLRRQLLVYFEDPTSQVTKALGGYCQELCIGHDQAAAWSGCCLTPSAN